MRTLLIALLLLTLCGNVAEGTKKDTVRINYDTSKHVYELQFSPAAVSPGDSVKANREARRP
jgi:hypothetical protein